jgi:hypothetical protein
MYLVFSSTRETSSLSIIHILENLLGNVHISELARIKPKHVFTWVLVTFLCICITIDAPHFVKIGSNVAALCKIDLIFFQKEMENLTEGVRVIRLYPANPDNYRFQFLCFLKRNFPIGQYKKFESTNFICNFHLHFNCQLKFLRQFCLWLVSFSFFAQIINWKLKSY